MSFDGPASYCIFHSELYFSPALLRLFIFQPPYFTYQGLLSHFIPDLLCLFTHTLLSHFTPYILRIIIAHFFILPRLLRFFTSNLLSYFIPDLLSLFTLNLLRLLTPDLWRIITTHFFLLPRPPALLYPKPL